MVVFVMILRGLCGLFWRWGEGGHEAFWGGQDFKGGRPGGVTVSYMLRMGAYHFVVESVSVMSNIIEAETVWTREIIMANFKKICSD
jgi:hypothetical protein